MKTLNIGLVGLNSLGYEVANNLIQNGKALSEQANANLVLKKTSDLVLKETELDSALFTSDPLQVVNDPTIDIVVDTTDDLQAAEGFVTQVLNNKKSVVTSNSKMLAKSGNRLFKLAKQNKANIYFSGKIGRAHV